MAMANQVADATMSVVGMEEGMPCCPDQKSSTADCQKACPLAVMCMAKCFPNAADWSGHGDMVESLAGVIALNRPGSAGGSNFQLGWSHDEQDDEQVFT